jgi:hypothetical protein
MGFTGCERAQNAQTGVWETHTAFVQWCLGGVYVCTAVALRPNPPERLT